MMWVFAKTKSRSRKETIDRRVLMKCFVYVFWLFYSWCCEASGMIWLCDHIFMKFNIKVLSFWCLMKLLYWVVLSFFFWPDCDCIIF